MNTNIVLPDHITSMIKEMVKKFNFCEAKIVEVTSPTKPGDNWLGQILLIAMLGSDSRKQPVKLSVIAKLAPTPQLYRNFHSIPSLFKCEIYFYNNVLPELIKIQKENHVQKLFLPFAKCYSTQTHEPQEALLLENMIQHGFKKVNERETTDYQHALLVMKSIGKFHALSFALRKQKPEVFKELGANIKSDFFNTNFYAIIQNLGFQVLGKLKKNHPNYEEFNAFVQNPFSKMSNQESVGEYGVIVHGDLHLRNILFKYEDELNPGFPSDLCLIDWQFASFGSPVVDISLFMWVYSDRSFRERYYQNLLDEYYNSFSMYLRELGCTPEESFPVDAFEDHLKKFSSYGICLGLLLIFDKCFDEGDVPDVQSAESNNSLVQMLSTVPEGSLFFNHMKELLEDFAKYHYKI